MVANNLVHSFVDRKAEESEEDERSRVNGPRQSWKTQKALKRSRQGWQSVSHENSIQQIVSLLLLTYLLSHPGYFGKKGIKQFHVRKNRTYEPVMNLDKVWQLVSEDTKKAALANKDKAPVIDVTKAVINLIIISIGLLQGPRKG